jgi:1-deoxy-D-xylulose-5-phosphate synthase
MFVAIGAMVNPCVVAAEALRSRGIDAGVVNARFVKPLDTELLDQIAATDATVITVEDNALAGGFGSAVNEYWVERHYETVNLRNLGLPDRFIEHGDRDGLLAELGLSPDELVRFATEAHVDRGRSIRSVAT